MPPRASPRAKVSATLTPFLGKVRKEDQPGHGHQGEPDNTGFSQHLQPIAVGLKK